jgi:hypothetical protein
MTSTAVVTEDATTIVADEQARFNWGAVIAGAIAATATTFFLGMLGAGVGLGFMTIPPSASRATTFLTLGAIYFLAAQAFGFTVGGYLVGRLIGPEVENSKEEEFRAAAHGFAMWALAVVASILLVLASSLLTGSAILAGTASRDTNHESTGYWADMLFRPAPNTGQVLADKAEATRIMAMDIATNENQSDDARLARLVSQDAGLSPQAAADRVSAVKTQQRKALNDARRAASIASLWAAFAMLFGAAVSVAAAIAARWMDDRITFSFAPRVAPLRRRG